MIAADEEFLRIESVLQKSGLSRSEIYDRMKRGAFPQSRSYRDSSRRFWLLSDIRRWQAAELGVAVAETAELIG